MGDVTGRYADVTGDRVADIGAFDQDGDGRIETLQLDRSGDGVVDTVGYDDDADGRIDVIQIDTTGDGVLDTTAADTDADGSVETVVQDLDQDGGKDRTIVDLDRNGRVDAGESTAFVTSAPSTATIGGPGWNELPPAVATALNTNPHYAEAYWEIAEQQYRVNETWLAPEGTHWEYRDEP